MEFAFIESQIKGTRIRGGAKSKKKNRAGGLVSTKTVQNAKAEGITTPSKGSMQKLGKDLGEKNLLQGTSQKKLERKSHGGWDIGSKKRQGRKKTHSSAGGEESH